MAHKHEAIINGWSDDLQAAIEKIQAEAQEHRQELNYIATRVTNALKPQQAFLHSLTGKRIENTVASEHDVNQPVKQVMGKAVEYRKPVSKEDVKPTDLERDNYLRDVRETLAAIPKMSNEQVFKKAELPGGSIVIRGIAKRLDIEDYDSMPIDVVYVGKIRAAIKAKADAEQVQKDAMNKVNQTKK